MMGTEGEIVLCFECGTKNRLKEGWVGSPVCGKCGEPLPVTARPARTAASGTSAGGMSQKPASWWPVIGIAVVFVLLLVGIFAWQGAKDRQRLLTDAEFFSGSPSASAAPAAPQPTPSPSVAEPPAGLQEAGVEPAAAAQTPQLDTSGLTPVERTWDKVEIFASVDAWIEIRRPGGGIVVSKVLKGGQTYTVPGEPSLILNTGNAGGIIVALNGRNWPPLGGFGAVKRDIPLRPASPVDQNPFEQVDQEAPKNPFEQFAQPGNASGSSPADAQALPPGIVKAVPVKPGIIVLNTAEEALAPFEIKTSLGEDYYVKLVDNVTEKTVVGIFVKGGHTLNVDVPLGSYKMRYASGKVWQGPEKLFGDETGYSASNDVFNFNVVGDQISGYTVELIKQAGGNLESHRIDAAQF